MSDFPPPYFAPASRVSVDGRALDPAQARSIAEVTVIHEIGASDQFRAVFTNPYPTLPWTHGANRSLFRLGAGVTIEMGYNGDLRPLFDGEVTGLAPDFPGDGASTLGVEGLGRLHRLDGPRRTRTFQDVTDGEIAHRVAQAIDLSSWSDPTPIRHNYVLQSSQTDLEFLRERATAIGFELLVDGRTLVFRGPRFGTAASASLQWGHTLRRFRPTLDSSRPVTEVTVRGYDPETKAEIVGRAAAGPGDGAMGERSGAALVGSAFGRRPEVAADRRVSSQAEAERYAKVIFGRRMMELITGEGASMGNPALRAGSVVDIQGVGEDFSGPYYVVRSVHTIDANGFETQFSVKKNALP